MRPIVLLFLILSALSLSAQQQEPRQPQPSDQPASSGTAAQDSQAAPAPASSGTAAQDSQPVAPAAAQPGETAQSSVSPDKRQPKRILGVMPNFRAISAGEVPPPPTAKQNFMLATRNSFDYSSFIFVGMTSAIAEWTDAHAEFGEGMPGFARYYWHGFADKTIGNYMVLFAFPTVLHEDERYYSMGKGGFWKRTTYASTRIFITPDYHGHNTFNASEIFGRAAGQAISASYYPSQSRNAGKIAQKYAYALGRDALTNVFREFWPDISSHLFHRQP